MQAANSYAFGSRILHWLIAALVLVLIPVGLWMASRAEINLFDDLTNTLYAWHKAIGFTVLLLMVVRIVVKARNAAPAYPASMPRWQVIAAKSLHHLLYVLLILTPLLGWAGVTAFPALITLGGYDLPAMPFVPQDQALATQLFGIHGVFAITLAVLIAGHIAAAVIHLVVRKDGVFQRMWFGR
ncbi:MAG: cytochrome b [Gammaproteobacteria bacterium]|nr:cytochrome b [Gammaproteobacteria bacterium]MDP2139839.1 cytochrome b [Gammaproteobacteria bacterium]MDP2347080.1 cytochrome b [Gammaproteobacteria bacterium]